MAISPNGSLVLLSYEKGGNSFVYRVDVETGKASRLTRAEAGTEFGPMFSPDGKLIAYSYRPREQTRSTIVVSNVDGSDLHPWSPPEASDFSPVFSPDNHTIVFSRSAFFGSYSPLAQPHLHEWSFYASELDGNNVRQLTNERFYMASPASVSADGKSMVVVTEGLDTSRRIAIYSLTHSGPPTQTLQPHVPKEADHKDPILAFPNYMPDGKSILFVAASNGKRIRLRCLPRRLGDKLSGKGYDWQRIRDRSEGLSRRKDRGVPEMAQ